MCVLVRVRLWLGLVVTVRLVVRLVARVRWWLVFG